MQQTSEQPTVSIDVIRFLQGSAVAELVRSGLRNLCESEKWPPLVELTQKTVMYRLAVHLSVEGHRQHARAEYCEVSAETLRYMVDAVARLQADAGWERIRRMLTGRARVQLCLMRVPERLLSPDDLAQSALQRAIERRDQFCGTSDGEYRGWIKVILDRLLLDRRRELTRGDRGELRTFSVNVQCERWSTQGGLQLADSQAVTGSEAARQQETVDLLYAAIERLSGQERAVVVQKLAEHTFDEISSATGMHKATVVRRYQSALTVLHRTLRGLA